MYILWALLDPLPIIDKCQLRNLASNMLGRTMIRIINASSRNRAINATNFSRVLSFILQAVCQARKRAVEKNSVTYEAR